MKLIIAVLAIVTAGFAQDVDKSKKWVVYEGGEGPGKGKHIVLLAGDEEYRSEEAMPMLGVTLILSPSRSMGSLTAWQSFSATCAESSASASGSITTNSSPARRATVSAWRSAWDMRCATVRRTTSPAL